MLRFAVRLAASAVLAATLAHAGELTVASLDPPANTTTAPVGGRISVTFDRPIFRDSVTTSSFAAFGRWSGVVSGSFDFTDGDHTVSIVPALPLSAGEMVMVVLSHDLQAVDGSFLRPQGYSYQFYTRARRAPLSFTQLDSMSTRTSPGQTSRAYGGVACDLNQDRFLDLAIVNEDTADLRVFLNRADGSGLFHDFIQPTFPLVQVPSPSEPADFNADGITDIAVANTTTNKVSVLLGDGDGTFAPQIELTVGSGPRGIAVLDADGDGDMDIATANQSSSNISVILGNGDGTFGPAASFDAGGSSEWALGAGDMNEDGILDLIVGTQGGQQVIVLRGNGDGTFTNITTRTGVGRLWMLNIGDLNGDGHMDVATVNSSSNTGSILLGDGAGGLSLPVPYSLDPFPLATDLGDIDGDGDLDWVTSSFNGDWRLYINDGTGTFAFNREFNAPAAASCALPFDLDNDGDLDLALIDELADVVIIMRTGGNSPPGDLDGDCDVDFDDLVELLSAYGSTQAGDLDGDGDTDFNDLVILLGAYGGTCP